MKHYPLLFALPFIAGTGEKSPRRRPVAVLTVVVIFLVLGILTSMGTYAPWSPHMEAWSSSPVPVHYVEGRSPLEVQGALVLQNKQCRNCHSLDGSGGQRGPALDDVATRLTGDQLVRQVIQGGGNMPAYGKNLSPAEVAALVAFMQTLHAPHAAAARDATVPERPGEQEQQTHWPLAAMQRRFYLGAVFHDPALDDGVVHRHAAFLHQLFNMPVAHWSPSVRRPPQTKPNICGAYC